MNFFTSVLYIEGAVFGAAIGSFLGAVIERAKNKKQKTKLLWGRSWCGNCKRQLNWRENIPLISFVFLKGRCRTCRSPIPYWLPLIELAGAAAGAAVAAQIGLISLIGLIGLILVAAALIWVFFSDLVYGVIPDLAVGIGAIGSVIFNFQFSIFNFVIAALGAAAFFYFLVLVTRRRGMGMGDATLAAFLGLWLGWSKILLAVWLAFILGAVVGLILIGLKLKKFGQTIPFGPFLIAASIIAAMANDSWMNIIGL
ncbi:prepilin peptidase [Candidatus Collierbacteria bacterium]|nr:prepilin peptidase [Candidatus Collierbacteria bacterium]